MGNSAAIALVKEARVKAEQSIDYTPKHGAVCPECGQKHIKIYASRPWEDDIKIRYHKCTNEECLLSMIGVSIKSVQSA